MQPANFDNIAYAEENVAEQIRQIFTRHFYEQRVVACPEQRPLRVWLAPFAEKVRQYGHGELPGYKERFAGVTAAGDYHMKKHWMFTAGFSYAAAVLKVPMARQKRILEPTQGHWALSGQTPNGLPTRSFLIFIVRFMRVVGCILASIMLL